MFIKRAESNLCRHQTQNRVEFRLKDMGFERRRKALSGARNKAMSRLELAWGATQDHGLPAWAGPENSQSRRVVSVNALPGLRCAAVDGAAPH
jgi:hypothetical protein